MANSLHSTNNLVILGEQGSVVHEEKRKLKNPNFLSGCTVFYCEYPSYIYHRNREARESHFINCFVDFLFMPLLLLPVVDAIQSRIMMN